MRLGGNTMLKWNRCLAFLLLLGILLPLLPVPVVYAGVELSEEKRETKAAVSVSSISVPSYSGGTSSGWMIYDGGLGTALGETGAQSKMRIVTGTTSTQYSTYRDLLKSKGYTVLFSRSCPAQSGNNRHYKFLSPDGTYVIYTYWTPATSQVRIIVDTHVDTLRKFVYNSPDRNGGSGRTEVYMYSLTASTDGFKNTSTYATENRSNSESMFIVKMPDNSLFVVDGGTYYQMSDRACEQLYDFMRSITGVPEDEKIVINTWFVSHLHFDHCAGFPRFLHKYNTAFELLNIMYNFDIEGASQKYIRRVARLFPNAKYYKQHTGETFNIAGVVFDVLYTVEDRYKPNSSNKLVLNDAACLGSYTEENNGSTVLRMTFDGKTMLLTGDLEKADAVLMKMYPAADLKCDLLQIPHHAFDNHTTLVKTIAPKISFINQAESAIRNREDIYDNNAAWKPYAGTIYYCGEKTVGYAADEGIFYNKVFDTVDFIDWSGRTYDVEEDNYINFDRQSNPFWATSETNTEVYTENERTIDNKEGVLKVVVAEDHAAGTNNNNLGPWISTTGVPGVYVLRGNKTFHGLGYTPARGDFVQVRFRLDGCVRAGEDTPTDIVLIYDRTVDGVCGRGTYDIVVPYEFKNGAYMTVDLPLTEEFTSASCISSIGFRFRGIKAETKGSGTLTLDYIYVGPEGTVPPTAQTVSFYHEDGTLLEEQRVVMGGTAVYSGTNPIKTYDEKMHYSFAGWVDEQGNPAVLENITEDRKVYASFVGQTHSYTEKLLTPSTCTGEGQKEYLCLCGYSYLEILSVLGHSPEIIPGTPATCTETGLSDGSYCTVCNEVLMQQRELPLAEHSPETIAGKAPTCTDSGFTEGSRCSYCTLTMVE